MGWQFKCTNCGLLLFDVPSVANIHPSLDCPKCGRTYNIWHDGRGNILVRRKGNKRAVKATKY